jgi:integrase
VHRDLIEASPVHLLYRPGGKERPKDRTLSDAEIKALLVNLDDVLRSPRMACAIRILLLAGQRRGQLALARWRDIDFEAKTWTIRAAHSKTGIARSRRTTCEHSKWITIVIPGYCAQRHLVYERTECNLSIPV